MYMQMSKKESTCDVLQAYKKNTNIMMVYIGYYT